MAPQEGKVFIKAYKGTMTEARAMHVIQRTAYSPTASIGCYAEDKPGAPIAKTVEFKPNIQYIDDEPYTPLEHVEAIRKSATVVIFDVQKPQLSEDEPENSQRLKESDFTTYQIKSDLYQPFSKS
jgi:hypothetical protein